MPQPTNRLARAPSHDAGPDGDHELAIAMRVEPTDGPAYQPRSRCSCSSSSSRAAARGQPPTAGVGWSRSTRSRMLRSSWSTPDTSLARCWSVGRRTMCGPGRCPAWCQAVRGCRAASRPPRRAPRGPSRMPAASSARVARRSTGSASRAVVPARAIGAEDAAVAATSRSGEAPRKVRSPRVNANTVTGTVQAIGAAHPWSKCPARPACKHREDIDGERTPRRPRVVRARPCRCARVQLPPTIAPPMRTIRRGPGVLSDPPQEARRSRRVRCSGLDLAEETGPR